MGGLAQLGEHLSCKKQMAHRHGFLLILSADWRTYTTGFVLKSTDMALSKIGGDRRTYTQIMQVQILSGELSPVV